MDPRKPSRIRKSVVVGTLVAAQLSGCASLPRPAFEPSVATLNDPATRTIADEGSDISLDVEAGYSSEDVFMLRPINEVGSVPDRVLPPMNLTESGVYDALRLLVKDSGLTLNIEGGAQGSEPYGRVSVYNVKGKLKDVLDELSESMGFFYSVRKNTLFVQPEAQFVVELPPALSDDNAAGLTNTLQYLGAKDPYVDRLNRSLVFKTNRRSLAKIESYLDKIRENRTLIIYDVGIWQVDLNDNADTGIAWNKLRFASSPEASVSHNLATPAGGSTTTTGGTGATPGNAVANLVGTGLNAAVTGGSVGLVLSSTKFSMDMLINFLKSQGSLKAISRPRLAVISGTKGTLRVGQATTYVSKVGSSQSNLINQVTTETRDLRTGLDLGLVGDFSDQTVYTRIGLSISEIIRLNKFTALGTDLTLPQTADREISTVIRARPGDLILLGGINVERDTLDATRSAGGSSTAKQVQRSELVLTLKTKIVYFKPKSKGKTQTPQAPSEPAPPAAVIPAPAVAVPAAVLPGAVQPIQDPPGSPLPVAPAAPQAAPALSAVERPAVQQANVRPLPEPEPVPVPVAPLPRGGSFSPEPVTPPAKPVYVAPVYIEPVAPATHSSGTRLDDAAAREKVERPVFLLPEEADITEEEIDRIAPRNKSSVSSGSPEQGASIGGFLKGLAERLRTPPSR